MGAPVRCLPGIEESPVRGIDHDSTERYVRAHTYTHAHTHACTRAHTRTHSHTHKMGGTAFFFSEDIRSVLVGWTEAVNMRRTIVHDTSERIEAERLQRRLRAAMLKQAKIQEAEKRDRDRVKMLLQKRINEEDEGMITHTHTLFSHSSHTHSLSHSN